MSTRAPARRIHGALAALLVLAAAAEPAAADRILMTLSGDPTNATSFGFAVASGDLNADGFPDLIVGVPRADVGGTDRGQVQVFFGGPVTDSIPDLVFHGVADGERFGEALAADGDLNADGIDDLVVGIPGAPNGGTARGRAAVYFGSAGFDSIPDLELNVLALPDGSQFGTSAAYVGDTNGDTFGDLLVGARDAGPGAAGAAYLFLGGTTPQHLPQQAFQGEVAGDDFGYAVGGGGDVDGDGFADLLVGAQDAQPGNDIGVAYLFLGGSSVPDADYDLRMPGVGIGDDFGFSLTAGGDVNGDGYDDWIVGAVENPGAPGYAKLYFGAETGSLDAAADLTFTGYTHDAWYGRWVELADVNRDGYSDVVVGAIDNYSRASGGQVYAYYGGPTPDNEVDLVWERLPGTSTSTGHFGECLDIVDDLDRDGFPEILIGEPLANPGNDAIAEGRVYLVTPVLGRFDPVRANAGVATQVTLDLADDVYWGETRLFWRVGGTAAFDSTDMGGTGSEPRTATIPGGVVGRRGVQFWARSTTVTTLPGFAYRSPPSGFGSVDVSLTGDTVVELAPLRYELIGLSMRATDPSPEAVFDELGPYDRRRWRYGVYDGSGYAEGPDAPPANPGQGFWIISKSPATIRVSGTCADLSRNSHTYSLRPGWTQIANPFGFAITLPAELPPGVIGNLTSWNGTRYESFQTNMQPGRGYWIRNDSGSPQQLTVKTGSGTLRSPAPSPFLLRDGERGWSLAVDAFIEERADGDHRFGQREGATDGVDALDFSDVPPPPEGYVQTSFLSDEGQPLMIDYRALGADGGRWRLALRSDLPGRPFAVRIRETAGLPAGWRLVAADRTGGIFRDLGRDPEITGTVPSDGSRLEWYLLAGTDSWIQGAAGEIEAAFVRAIEGLSLVVGPNPLPSGSVARILLTIPAPGPVDVSIHDVAGRLVRRLVRGPVDRGVLRLEWDGTNGSGRPAGSGVYFVRGESGGSRVTAKITRLQ